MKRISKTSLAPTRQSIGSVYNQVRALRSELNEALTVFARPAGHLRYLTGTEESTRRPLSPILALEEEAIAFCEEHFRSVMQLSLQEELHVLSIDGSGRVFRTHFVTVGLANKCDVHPREVFRPAILDAATAVMLVHNHPSGLSKISPADISTTKQLVAAGELLGIRVLDHIVLAREGSKSIRAQCPELFK